VLIGGVPHRTVVAGPRSGCIEILDQSVLPHRVAWLEVSTVDGAAHAIRSMQVRGAPLIGVVAGYGLAIAADADPSDAGLQAAARALSATRPTAVNLSWALESLLARVLPEPVTDRAALAWQVAGEIADADVAACLAIGRHGLGLLQALSPPPGRPLSVLTHCNAGWLATVDRGTALSPVYQAAEAGIAVHVWVSETRPRNQGLLTAWELSQQGVPHTLVADNAAGALIAAGQVDAVLVGADRIAANGDVANKVGTYLKALACADAGVPCFVLAPRSTIDPHCPDGAAIPIEERDGDEVRVVHGLVPDDGLVAGDRLPGSVRIAARSTPVGNPAFDVTPARLVTAIVTEAGAAPASAPGVAGLLTAP
jgi:methylthioribose-1-phosphate isomerase